MTTSPVEVHGGDAQLGDALASTPSPRIRFVPDGSSDLARALGMTAGMPVHEPIEIDALELDRGGVAVNMVVFGHAPDRRGAPLGRAHCVVEVDGRVAWDGRATTVLVANGEFLRGLDVVPRGHPGDGRLEVHVHALRAGQRRRMRARLPTGAHLPHPGIRAAQCTEVGVRWDRPVPLEVDGRDRGRAQALSARLLRGAAILVP